MVRQVLHCPFPSCGSHDVIWFGKTRTEYARYRCKVCLRTFSEAPSRGVSADVKALALAAYEERMSMRGIARTFKISRNTLSAWLKEKGGSCLR